MHCHEIDSLYSIEFRFKLANNKFDHSYYIRSISKNSNSKLCSWQVIFFL